MLIQQPQPDPRGWLVFDELPDDLQAAEDATAAADYERTDGGDTYQLSRPATPTERALLTHLGYPAPARLITIVTYHSTGVRTRTWPQLGGVTP